MKRTTCLIILILITIPCLWGDIPWIPYYEGDLMGSIEGLLSIEHGFSPKFTLGAWGGMAYVFTWVDNDYIRTWGFEGAMESRFYFLGDIYKGIYFGGYFGYGLMQTPEYYWESRRYDIWIKGFSGGLKLGGRLAVKDFSKVSLLVEPYISLSWVHDAEYRDEMEILITLGIRLLLNWKI